MKGNSPLDRHYLFGPSEPLQKRNKSNDNEDTRQLQITLHIWIQTCAENFSFCHVFMKTLDLKMR